MDPIRHANGDYTPLAVIASRILAFERQAGEYERCKLEVEASFLQVCFALCRIPCESDIQNIRLYIRTCNPLPAAEGGSPVRQNRW